MKDSMKGSAPDISYTYLGLTQVGMLRRLSRRPSMTRVPRLDLGSRDAKDV